MTTQEEREAYHEAEQNCNMCKHLVRKPHPKSIDGFLHGSCPRKMLAHIKFHPQDTMHMSCWEPRKKKLTVQ